MNCGSPPDSIIQNPAHRGPSRRARIIFTFADRISERKPAAQYKALAQLVSFAN
jgi:hypothetical protein